MNLDTDLHCQIQCTTLYYNHEKKQQLYPFEKEARYLSFTWLDSIAVSSV